jgi:hypothetical protein
MKIYLFSVLCLVALSSAASAQTQVNPGDIKLKPPTPAVISSPEYQISNGPQKRYQLSKWLEVEVSYDTLPEEIDELTFNYIIAVENRLLDGTVTYVNIPKGRDHFAVMYVTPKTLLKLTGGHALTAGSIQNVWVTVTHQGQTLDRIAYKPMEIPNLQHLSGLVLNKSETPFAPLYYDRYETIKASR